MSARLVTPYGRAENVPEGLTTTAEEPTIQPTILLLLSQEI